MDEYLISMGPALANHLWQSTAFAAVVWGLALLLRRNQARLRYGLWLVASAKFLVPFALLIGLGGMLPRPQHAVVTLPVYSAVDEVSVPFSEVQGVGEREQGLAESSQVSVAGSQRMTIPVALGLVWLCGVVAVVGVWGVRWLRVMRVARGAVRVEKGREVEALRRVERRVGARREMDVRIIFPGSILREAQDRNWGTRFVDTQRGVMEPGVFGVFRPVLIWPLRLSERLDDEHIEAIVAHELMHVRRRDNLTAVLHMLVEAAFWFHPAVWWMGARLVEERERACDEAVVELGSRPGVYAESLLKAVRFCVESPLVCVSGVTGADLKQRVRSIMTLRMRRLGIAGKVALAMLALAAIAGPVAFGVVRMIPLYGQVLKATGPLPSYAFVVIKPSQDTAHGADMAGEQTHYLVTAKLLIQFAYGVFNPGKPIALNVQGGPDWINNDVFDIVGKVSPEDFEKRQKMNRAQGHEQRQLMEQSLLADRFKLKVHTEMRDQPVLTLVVGKNLKLTPAKDATGGAHVNPYPGSMTPDQLKRGLIVQAKGRNFVMTVKGMTLDTLVDALIAQKETNGKPVVNQTGLTDAYDFTLTWGPEDSAGPESGDEALEPPLFTAIQQQLGLKLADGKAPAEAVVIDHIEKPVFDSAVSAAVKRYEDVAAAEYRKVLALPASVVPENTKARFVLAGQTGAESAGMRFDVVSVRPAAPQINTGGPGQLARRIALLFTDDGVSIQNGAVESLARTAYELDPSMPGRVLNAPEWVAAQRWSIEAKVADADVAAFSQIAHDNAPEAKHRRALMLQTLLAEQFKLKAHLETREGDVYTLEVAKGGATLKPGSTVALDPTGRRNGIVGFGFGPGHVDIPDGPVGLLASMLTNQLGAPVIDKTGLTSRYTIKLDWQPVTGASAEVGANDSGKPALETALQEQLGLKLVKGKGSLPVLVIDHIEKPASMNGAEVMNSTLPLKGDKGGAPAMMTVAMVQEKAQADAAALPAIRFDVVSIKPDKSDSGVLMFDNTADGIQARGFTVQMLVRAAYGFDDALIFGAPEWLNSDRYTLVAKVAGPDVPALAKLTRDQRNMMLRPLLVDQFQLRFHRDIKQLPVYSLVPAKGGLKLKESPPSDSAESQMRMKAGVLTCQRFSMSDLAQWLTLHVGRKVVDNSGLTGVYDFTLTWTPDSGAPAEQPGDLGSSLFAAIQEQLGLKLEPAKGPIETFVIDHVARPTEN